MALAQEKSTQALSGKSAPFIDWVEGWLGERTPLDLRAYLQGEGIGPERVAVVCVDVIVGFCYEGPLASPRIAAIVEPIAQLFSRAYDLGVKHFLLPQEHHTHDAAEFEQYGPHGIRDTREADTVDALRDLPFSNSYRVFLKNSIHPALGNGFNEWLDDHPEVDTFIVVGDCTDLCAHQAVMYLKLRGNEVDRRVSVIVPENCVQTYDLPVETARQIGALPHDGDLLHAVFLYHMALNGAQVVEKVV
ncbi:MAG: isochorismatase family protein [Chloroflexota bacterium]|nr:isochorismatase family protein [Chloroflexota bacterium]MDQ5866138.1 isochorismatase family protein [Chloroflexota bacterium]